MPGAAQEGATATAVPRYTTVLLQQPSAVESACTIDPLLRIAIVQLTAHRPPEDASRRAEVERPALRVGVVTLLLELHVLHLVADNYESTSDSASRVDGAREQERQATG